MMLPIIEFKLEGDLVKQKDPGYKKYISDLSSKLGGKFAHIARNRMAAMLAPGHKYRVGASGRSANNLSVTEIRRAVGTTTWAVEEGDDGANAIIRQGIRRGNRVPIKSLRKWVMEKGLNLKNQERPSQKLPRYISQRSRSGNRYVRALKREKAGEERPLFAIKKALWQKGTKRKGANWFKLFPTGQGRFDYVVWTLRQEGYFFEEMERHTDEITSLIAQYILSGRKRFGAEAGEAAYADKVY